MKNNYPALYFVMLYSKAIIIIECLIKNNEEDKEEVKPQIKKTNLRDLRNNSRDNGRKREGEIFQTHR